MTDNKVAIPDFLTPEEIARAGELWQELKGTGRFAATVASEIIEPQLARINAALGQENNAKYLAYTVEYVFGQVDKARPGHLWEWAEDTCQVCGVHIGAGLRFMHVGLCEACAKAPTH